MQRRSFREDRVYLLETTLGALVWREPPWANEVQRAASDRLASVIVARTSLPLRDLTEAWDTDDDTFHTLDDPAQVARRRNGRRIRWTLALLQFTLLVGLALAGYALQHHII